MKKIMNNKRGFTLVEIVCTIAIIVTLASVTSLGVHDYIENAEKARDIVVLTHNSQLDELETEVFATNGHSWASAEVVAEAVSMKSPEEVNDAVNKATIGGAIDNGLADVAGADAETPEKPDDPKTIFNANVEVARDQNPEYFDNQVAKITSLVAGVEDDGNLEDAIKAIAAAATSIREKYYNEQVATNIESNLIKFYTYCPATGAIEKVNGDGKTMTAEGGQSLATGDVSDQHLDSDFFTDPNKVIFVAVKGTKDKKQIEVIPCICIDVDGHLNTVSTSNYTPYASRGIAWADIRKNLQGGTDPKDYSTLYHILDMSGYDEWLAQNNYGTRDELDASTAATAWNQFISSARSWNN